VDHKRESKNDEDSIYLAGAVTEGTGVTINVGKFSACVMSAPPNAVVVNLLRRRSVWK